MHPVHRIAVLILALPFVLAACEAPTAAAGPAMQRGPKRSTPATPAPLRIQGASFALESGGFCAWSYTLRADAPVNLWRVELLRDGGGYASAIPPHTWAPAEMMQGSQHAASVSVIGAPGTVLAVRVTYSAGVLAPFATVTSAPATCY